MKAAMVAIQRKLESMNSPSKMILTVHDELVFEVPEADLDATRAMVKEQMENVVKLDVPLLVECGHGHTWGQAH